MQIVNFIVLPVLLMELNAQYGVNVQKFLINQHAPVLVVQMVSVHGTQLIKVVEAGCAQMKQKQLMQNVKCQVHPVRQMELHVLA